MRVLILQSRIALLSVLALGSGLPASTTPTGASPIGADRETPGRDRPAPHQMTIPVSRTSLDPSSPSTSRAATTAPSPAPATTPAAPQGSASPSAAAVAHFKKGNDLARAGKWAEAEREFREADRLQPDEYPLLEPLANAQLKLGKTDAALETLEHAIRRGRHLDDRVYILAARVFSDRKLGVLGEKKLIEWAADRQATANFHAAIGLLRLSAVDLANAERELRVALDQDPANEAALTGMARLYTRFQKFDKLEPFLEKGLAAKPASITLLMLAGNCQLEEQKLAEAKAKFEKVLTLDPRNTSAMVNLGSAEYQLGHPDVGVGWFRKALAADPANPDAVVNLSLALERAGQAAGLEEKRKKFAEARDILVAARKTEHTTLGTLNILSALVIAYHLNGQIDEAIQVARESLKRDPGQKEMKSVLKRLEDERDGKSAPLPGSLPYARKGTAAAPRAGASPAAPAPSADPAPDPGSEP